MTEKKDPKKWIVKFEFKAPDKKGLSSKITQNFFDAGFLGTDIQKVGEKTSRPFKSLLTAALWLNVDYREYKSPTEIIPPPPQQLSGRYYIIWIGITPEIVASFGIKTQEGDDTYDFKVLINKKKEKEYELIGIAADEPGLKNTKTQLKKIIRFILDEPKKTKYVRLFRLKPLKSQK
jgi:hypothetical protein